MQDLKTRTQNYPKPHVNNVLQDDVRRIGEAFEMVDKDINEREGRYETQVDLTQYPTDYFFPVWFVAGGNDDGITRVQVLRHFSDKPLAAALNVQMDVCDYAWGGDAAVFSIRYLAQDYMKTFRRAQRSMLSVSRPIDGKHELYIKDSEGKEVNCPVQSGFYLRGGLNYKVITNTPRTIHYYQQPKPEANADYEEVQIAWRRDVDGNKRPYENQWMVKPYHEDNPKLGEDYAEIRPANSQQELEEQMNAAEANAKAASLPLTGGMLKGDLEIFKDNTRSSVFLGEGKDGSTTSNGKSYGFEIAYEGGVSNKTHFNTYHANAKPTNFMTINRGATSPDFKGLPTVDGKPLALDQDVQSLQQRLDDANDVYELIKATTQVMQSGGTFTPTAEAMYPDVASIDVDTQWLLRFDAVDGSLTFSDGDLKDKTAHSGDILFYNTPSNSFILIPSAQSQLLNDAVSQVASDLNESVPTGSLTTFVRDQVRPGYLKCDGAAYLKADYPQLAAYLADAYNLEADNAETHFRVPKMLQKERFRAEYQEQITGKVSYPRGSAVHEGILYVTSSSSNRVYLYDLANKAWLDKAFTTQSSPSDCLIAHGLLYVVNASSHSITAYDLETKALKYSSTSGLSAPRSCCLVGEYIYVTSWSNNQVAYFKAQGLSHVSNFSGNMNYPQGIASDGQFLYVANRYDDSRSYVGSHYHAYITIYDVKNHNFVDYIRLHLSSPSRNAHEFRCTVADGLLYVTSLESQDSYYEFGSCVRVFDTRTRNFVGEVSGMMSNHMACTVHENTMYVCSYGGQHGNKISVYDVYPEQTQLNYIKT